MVANRVMCPAWQYSIIWVLNVECLLSWGEHELEGGGEERRGEEGE